MFIVVMTVPCVHRAVKGEDNVGVVSVMYLFNLPELYFFSLLVSWLRGAFKDKALRFW